MIGNETLETRLREMERRLAKLETSPRAPFTSITNEAGDVVTTLSEAGLDIVEGAITVGGGPVRALDLVADSNTVLNSILTTTPVALAPAVVTVPTWAISAQVLAWTIFQLSNSSGASAQMLFRCEIEGLPGSGSWSNSVPNGEVGNTTDLYRRTLTGASLGTMITARSVVWLGAGTNVANAVRTHVLAFFYR